MGEWDGNRMGTSEWEQGIGELYKPRGRGEWVGNEGMGWEQNGNGGMGWEQGNGECNGGMETDREEVYNRRETKTEKNVRGIITEPNKHKFVFYFALINL
jgi:hypothetical protein